MHHGIRGECFRQRDPVLSPGHEDVHRAHQEAGAGQGAAETTDHVVDIDGMEGFRRLVARRA